MNENEDGDWNPAPKLLFKRGDFPITAYTNTETNASELVVCGGLGTKGTYNPGSGDSQQAAQELFKMGAPLQTTEVLKIDETGKIKKSWSTLANMPEYARGCAIHIQCDNYLYVIGGLCHKPGTDPKDKENNGASSRVDRLKLY